MENINENIVEQTLQADLHAAQQQVADLTAKLEAYRQKSAALRKEYRRLSVEISNIRPELATVDKRIEVYSQMLTRAKDKAERLNRPANPVQREL